MSVVDGITGILLNKLEGLSADRCKEACFKLLRWVSQNLEKFMRLMTRGKALFSWVGWLLSKFLKGETPEPSKPVQTASPVQQLGRRIVAVKEWLVQREKEFESRKICGACKQVHTKIEHDSGFSDDGSGKWNCMGWARMKLADLEDELHYLRKRIERVSADKSYLSLKSRDDQAPRTRQLTIQDIAQRFNLTVGQVKCIAENINEKPSQLSPESIGA